MYPAKNQLSATIREILKNSTYRYFIRLFLFILLYKTGEYLFKYLETTSLLAAVADQLYYYLSSFITVVSVKFYTLFFGDITATEDFTILINGRPVIMMMHGCTGLMQLFQVSFILLFFPVAIRRKAMLFPLSLMIILAASVLHYIILVPVAYAWNNQFVLFHDIISRVVFYAFFFFNFVIWNRSSEKQSVSGGKKHTVNTA